MRKILHVDMDAFFASVEQLDHPELRGKPVIVGGSSDRGVVATCSYEARKYGIHSAQPTYMAKKLCPNAIFVSGNHSRYSEVSKQIFDILYSICDKVQVVSIDEAYLDVTDLFYSPTYIAKYIKKRVKEEIGLTLSVGISYNKFLAKLASDWNKPDGIMEISEAMIPDILRPLAIRKVHGLGKKSVEKLNKIGIFTIDDMLKYDKAFYESFMGKFGAEIYDRIHGIDDREVHVSSGERKSIGTENTLREDTDDVKELKGYLSGFAEKIEKSLTKKHVSVKTVTIKLKTHDFQLHTRSKTLTYFIYKYKDIEQVAHDLLDEYQLETKVRLIGLTVSNFEDREQEQLTFFENI
ncbi:DNA polymerase IV [Acidaminobacter sp. JC074]|uniref:DNA polymerase IV n=1 Tax=Acidaminobacter sp. JC074 TaxID=2530199 RepID=UPI0021039D27|nr:DNA polymerase IV [Acidaminobacter sp. JC074]